GPPTLQNRQLKITRIDPTHFSLTDALTGATIDGSTLGAFTGTATVSRVQEIASPYVGSAWASLRAIQAELTATLLQASFPPQLMTATPAAGGDAQFGIVPITFLDGPYLDPFTNGVQAVPGAKSGNISLTLAFRPWSATLAYTVGSFVSSGGINYVSLQ